MISSFLLILTIGVSSPITTITPFHSVDYDNPKAACETAKTAVNNQLKRTLMNNYHQAECIQIPE